MLFLFINTIRYLLTCLVINGFNCLPVSPSPLLVISFDGFRYDYLDLYPTPNFKRIELEGVRAKWMTSVFVTKTYPNHFSLITGLYEESHGIVGNNMFDPHFNETFNFDNVDPKWWYNGVSVPIWYANQKADPNRHSGGIMWVSTSVPYFGHPIKYVEHYNLSVPWKRRLDIALEWISADKDPANLVLVYIEEPDATGHLFGPESPEVREKVMAADGVIGYLLAQLELKKLSDKLNLIVLSDHGMAANPPAQVISFDKILDRSMYKQYGHSPVWNIVPEPGFEETVRQKLIAGSNLFSYTFYEKDSIPDDYHYRNNDRIMPFVVVVDEGWEIDFDSKTFWRDTNRTGGEHGYNNSLMSMHPIFLARGPAFKKGFLAKPFMNVDVYPLMCHLLDLPPPIGINGSLEGVKQLLVDRAWVISSTWIVTGATLLCLCLAGTLTGVVISTACKRGPPTISFVPLSQHSIYRDEPSLGEEHNKLLHTFDATD